MAKAKADPAAKEHPLVKEAWDAKSNVDLAAAVKKLTPEEAEYFVIQLEASMRKRKLQITGYFVSMILWLGAMMFALVYYGTHGGFVGWVFLLPFGLVGLNLYVFGMVADAIVRTASAKAAALAKERRANDATNGDATNATNEPDSGTVPSAP